jgi:hypothetical protein
MISATFLSSQKRVMAFRKQAIRKREAKLEKYNRPKGQRRVREPKEKRKEREEKLERFSRPKGQKLKKKNNNK